jgi:hypothetical protein
MKHRENMGIVIMTRITYLDKCTSGDGVRVLHVFMEPVSSSVGTNEDLLGYCV